MKIEMKDLGMSEELYDAIERQKYDKDGQPTGVISTQWIHLQSAVQCKTVSPMEAYDAIKLGYVPAVLLTRKSKYSRQVTMHCRF